MTNMLARLKPWWGTLLTLAVLGWTLSVGAPYLASSLFSSAIGGGFTATAGALCWLGADPNQRDEHGKTPLHAAAFEGDSAAVAALLELGADVNAADFNGKTSLHWSAWQGRREMVVALLDAGADVNRQDVHDTTALHSASLRGFDDIAATLIERGADVNAQIWNVQKYRHGWSPLHFAAWYGNDRVARTLVEAGANVTLGDKRGSTPLDVALQRAELGLIEPMIEALERQQSEHRVELELLAHSLRQAARRGRWSVFEYLLELGASPVARDRLGRTPLHHAAQGGNERIVSRLVEMGAELAAADRQGRLPLHYAATLGRLQAAKRLIELGTPAGALDGAGRNSVFAAFDGLLAEEDALRMCELLVARGADPLAASIEGQTPLHWAAHQGYPRVVAMLLERGADPNAASDFCSQPLHWAVAGYAAGAADPAGVIKQLVAHGADLNARGQYGQTPLELAEEGRYRTLVKLLETLGAKP